MTAFPLRIRTFIQQFAPQFDLAQQLIKDPYNLSFLTLTNEYNERELKKYLVDHITKFLLDLGSGFAFIG